MAVSEVAAAMARALDRVIGGMEGRGGSLILKAGADMRGRCPAGNVMSKICEGKSHWECLSKKSGERKGEESMASYITWHAQFTESPPSVGQGMAPITGLLGC